MEDDEVAVGRIHLRLVLLIGVDELHIVIVGLLVAVVEDMAHDVGGIEESHRGIKLLVHLGSGKLVAVENHVVTALAQQQRKQGGIAPGELGVDGCRREKLLEVLRRAIVRGYHVVKHIQGAVGLARL